MEHDKQKDPVAWSMYPTTSAVDLSDRDSKETLLVKEEETNDAEVFGEVVVDVAGAQRKPSSSALLLVSTVLRAPA